jgi:hypothetical protein
MEHATQETIALHTNKGLIGYRIKKLQVISETPGKDPQDYEFICKVYKTDQSANIDGVVNFSDQRLLGVCFYQSGNVATEQSSSTIIFDNDVFNQDIYITMFENAANANFANYYIELEQMSLDLSEQTVATLKDIRNIGAE